MTDIHLDKQLVIQTCPHCQQDFSVYRGSVYNEDKPIALYLAALHKCFQGKNVHLAIGFPGGYLSHPEPIAIAMSITTSENNFDVRIVNPDESPWRSEHYLGRMMGQEEARASTLKDTVFHITDHIVLDIQEINDYLVS